jgi:hypothetical protein
MNNRATVMESMKVRRIKYREFAGLVRFGQDRFLCLIQESTL